MSAIKKFFEKKKREAKFKLAGPGHRLNEESRPSVPSAPERRMPPRTSMSEEAKQAAAAALARLEQKPEQRDFNSSLAAVKAQVKRELEAESKANEKTESTEERKPVQQLQSEFLAIKDVLFKCPLIGPDVLPRDELEKKIREFLYQQLEEERGLTACLIIHTCNKNREKVKVGVETLCKYLENIIEQPTEEKYRKIRMSNRVFQDRVNCLEGTLDFLLAAGFEMQKLEHQGVQEDFLVYPEEKCEHIEALVMLRDALQTCEPIIPELDRGLQVLSPGRAKVRFELPLSFYNLSADELKREQQLRTECVERNLMMRTKAMREKDEQREMRKYRYALIRVRFPDGILIQGTFRPHEKFSAVVEFVRETLANDWMPFILNSATGHKITEEDATLFELHLVPASILAFSYDPSLAQDVETQSSGEISYLRPDVMELVQTL